MKKHFVFCLVFLSIFALKLFCQENFEECTIGIISGKATVDGRPLLWKTRDTRELNNEVIYCVDGHFKYLALEDAGSTNSARAGINEKGFCIIAANSTDLPGNSKHGMGNGAIKTKALQTCETVDDFEALLKQTNVQGRRTKGNIGVIDAFGGAALFETGHNSYTRFDANDPKVAPQGYIVRANFAMTGGGNKGKIRYMRAKQICEKSVVQQKLDYRYLLRTASRDLADERGKPYPIPVIGKIKDYPQETINTSDTINRWSTAAAVVFHGVMPNENPSFTTFWVILGEPIFSIAIPCWINAESVAKELDGEKYSSLCSSVLDIKRANYYDYGEKKRYLKTNNLKCIWTFTYPIEDKIFDQTDKMLTQWRKKYPKTKDVLRFHESMVSLAMDCIQKVKQNLIVLPRSIEDKGQKSYEATDLSKNMEEGAFSNSKELRLIALGQALIEYDLRKYAEDSFRQLTEYLKDADVCFSNLEVSIKNKSSGERTRDSIYFHAALPEVLDCLKKMGINMLALSNNHSWDLGTQGILATIEEVEKRNFSHAGTGVSIKEATAPAYLDTPGGKVALVAMASGGLKGDAPAKYDRPGVNELKLESNGVLNPEDVQRNLNSIREAAGCADYVLVYQHNHYWEEDNTQTPQWLRKWAHLCIDSGATCFIGHGTPLLHGIEIYKGRPIFYSLGNFIFHTKTASGHYEAYVWQSVVADCYFKRGELISIKLRPLVLNEKGKPGKLFYKTRGAPLLAEGEAVQAILKRLVESSRIYSTDIKIEKNYAEIRVK